MRASVLESCTRSSTVPDIRAPSEHPEINYKGQVPVLGQLRLGPAGHVRPSLGTRALTAGPSRLLDRGRRGAKTAGCPVDLSCRPGLAAVDITVVFEGPVRGRHARETLLSLFS
jgi:hypothetical protein